MSEEFATLQLVCGSLEEAALPYMITGAFATNFYAIPRITRDLDLVIALGSPHADRFIALFQRDFYLRPDAIAEAVRRETMFNIIHSRSVCKVDRIIRESSAYRLEEFRRRRRVLFNNTPIWIVAPKDLILSKLQWAEEGNSEQQLRDMRNLMQAVEELDRDYLYFWMEKLQLKQVFERVKSNG